MVIKIVRNINLEIISVSDKSAYGVTIEREDILDTGPVHANA